jgi:hypothetical protein
MKLERLPYDPATVLDFYEEGLSTLGALSERTWHDRLEVVAEGPAARLWNSEGKLQEMELKFGPADTAMARDAAREVFPGSPLTFRLAEALRPRALQVMPRKSSTPNLCPAPGLGNCSIRSRISFRI